MKIKIKTKELKNALALHQKTTKNSYPGILEGVKLKASGGSLDIISTNLEQSLKTKIDCGVVVEGKVIIPYKVISNTVKYCDDDNIDIELLEDNKLKVDKLKINTLSLEEYPEFPIFEDGITLKKLDFDSFINSIDKLKNFPSGDKSRATLAGFLFDTANNCLVATDSYKMGVSKYYFNRNAGKFIIPYAAYNILKDIYKYGKGKKFTMLIEENQICFIVDNNILFSRLIDGKYPEYAQLIPGGYNYNYEFNSKEIIKILDKSKKVIPVNYGIPDKFKFNSNTIDIIKTCKEIGEYQDKANIRSMCNKNNGELEMGFNGDFFKQCIENFDTVQMFAEGPLKPVVFKNDDEYQTMLMPVRTE